MCLKFETSQYFSSLRLPSDLAPHNLVHKALKLASRLSAALLGVSLALIWYRRKNHCSPGTVSLPCHAKGGQATVLFCLISEHWLFSSSAALLCELICISFPVSPQPDMCHKAYRSARRVKPVSTVKIKHYGSRWFISLSHKLFPCCSCE